ncbi:MAG: HAMP domain-containing sensor histidine kinase [Eubacteriales bacterium]|nr:HAMP domain-containing sensor histidine kinase [Eubacteriales bacterium]
MKKIKQKHRSMSIRSRIFIYFLLFTALLLVLLWLFQIVFLDVFYRMQKTDGVQKASESIARNIEHEEIETLIDRLGQENGVCILVTDEKMNTVYSSDTTFGCIIHHLNPRDLRRMTEHLDQDGDTDYSTFPMTGFPSSKYDDRKFDGHVPPPDTGSAKSLISVRRVTLSDGSVRFVFLNTLITPVTSTVQTIRNELFFITGILVLLSFLLSWLLSRHISRPIAETTVAARELSVGEYHPVHSRVSYREIDELNGQLEQAAKDLHRVEEMQRELIANISHDLRTPLTLIEGYVEVMRDLPGENTTENMQVVIDETKRLSTLVNAVLDYSKGKNGKEELHLSRFSLTKSIRGIIERYGKLIEQDGYRILFSPQRDAMVLADELQVSQVVYNLVNNALTYTGEDKTVTIEQTIRENKIRIEIKDSGEGIEPDELPFIWSRYYRGQKPHKRPTVGTGLGLNIAQGILEKHGMEYGVESTVGQGSNFWFELPETDESTSHLQITGGQDE